MVSAEQAREFALFFLLSLLDQKQALQAAHKSIAQLKGMKLKGDAHSQKEVARVLRKTFDSQRKTHPRNRPAEISEAAVKFPYGTDLATWSQFHSSSSDGEVTAIVLTKVLGFSAEAVADGFNISQGTMKYRLAKGMRQLGATLAKRGAST